MPAESTPLAMGVRMDLFRETKVPWKPQRDYINGLVVVLSICVLVGAAVAFIHLEALSPFERPGSHGDSAPIDSGKAASVNSHQVDEFVNPIAVNRLLIPSEESKPKESSGMEQHKIREVISKHEAYNETRHLREPIVETIAAISTAIQAGASVATVGMALASNKYEYSVMIEISNFIDKSLTLPYNDHDYIDNGTVTEPCPPTVGSGKSEECLYTGSSWGSSGIVRYQISDFFCFYIFWENTGWDNMVAVSCFEDWEWCPEPTLGLFLDIYYSSTTNDYFQMKLAKQGIVSCISAGIEIKANMGTTAKTTMKVEVKKYQG